MSRSAKAPTMFRAAVPDFGTGMAFAERQRRDRSVRRSDTWMVERMTVSVSEGVVVVCRCRDDRPSGGW